MITSRSQTTQPNLDRAGSILTYHRAESLQPRVPAFDRSLARAEGTAPGADRPHGSGFWSSSMTAADLHPQLAPYQVASSSSSQMRCSA